MDLKDRIATIIKVNKHTASSFAELIGIQRSSLSHILNGRNKPSIDFIQKVLVHFPNIDAKWLITGQEPRNHSVNDKDVPKNTPKDRLARSVNAGFENPDQKDIERIVVFFADNTFVEYEPRK